MRSVEDGSSGVPAFLLKLWKLVEDPSCDALIRWSSEENSFIIQNQAEFAKKLLPLYFKHNNMASFIRQLNMYGFRKVTNITKSSLHDEDDEIEFHHPCFAKQRKDLLPYIKRKTSVSSGKSSDSVNNYADSVQDILTDVKVLQVRQENVNSLLAALTQENEALWREVALLRKKHAKQQQIVTQLIQFLLTIVQPANNRKKWLKRKLPLMIDEGESTSDNQLVSKKSQKTMDFNLGRQSLVIKDVTDHLDNEYIFSQSPNEASCSSYPQTEIIENNPVECVDSAKSLILDTQINPTTSLEPPIILEPIESSDDMIDPKQVEMQLLEILRPADTSDETPPDVYKENITSNTSKELAKKDQNITSSLESSVPKMENFSKNSFTEHLEDIDNELSWLHDQLSSEQMNIDASNLLSLFSAEDNIAGNNLALGCSQAGDGCTDHRVEASSSDLETWSEECLDRLLTHPPDTQTEKE